MASRGCQTIVKEVNQVPFVDAKTYFTMSSQYVFYKTITYICIFNIYISDPLYQYELCELYLMKNVPWKEQTECLIRIRLDFLLLAINNVCTFLSDVAINRFANINLRKNHMLLYFGIKLRDKASIY